MVRFCHWDICQSLFSLELSLPCAVLVRFCSEGDNTSDAIELAAYFDQWKRVVIIGHYD